MIEIFEGPKVTVHDITFTGNHFFTAAQLRTRLDLRNPVRRLFGQHRAGRLDEDRQELIDYYSSQGFFEVKVTSVTRPGADPGQVDLSFVISEGARYMVRNVIIKGNTRIKTETLREHLELHSGKPFTLAMRDADKNRMLRQYGEIGFIGAQIVCEHRFTEEPGVVDLVYKIEENEPFFSSELRVDANGKPKN